MAQNMKEETGPATRSAQRGSEPRFGHQCRDDSSARRMGSNMPNPGDEKREQAPTAGGASYERAGPSGQYTNRIPGSQYKLENPPKDEPK